MYSIYLDGDIAYSSVFTDNSYLVENPTLEQEIGKSGSFSFTIYPNHKKYDSIKDMLTLVEVYRDNYMLFRGRVAKTTKGFYNQKEIYCEGDLSFFIDSIQDLGEFEETPKQSLSRYIEKHNSQVEVFKNFTLGNVDVENSDKVRSFSISSYTSTKDLMDDLVYEFGGYFRTRKVDSIVYLDWVKEYGRTSNQQIEFGKNLLDYVDETDSEETYTILIPIGNDDMDISSVNNGKKYIEIQNGINLHGKIYKVKEFPEATSPSDLLAKANEFIANKFVPDPKLITIKAVDLSLITNDIDSIYVGDKARIRSTPHKLDKEYICSSITQYFSNPSNNEYTFSDPKQDLNSSATLTSRYTNSVSDLDNGIQTNNRNNAETRSILEDYIRVTDETLLLHANEIEINARDISLNAEKININAEELVRISVGLDDNSSEIQILNDKILTLVTSDEFQSSFTQLANEIELRVTQTDFDEEVGQLSASIKVNANGIASKVSKGEIISSINQTAESIKIKASRIELSGYVTASQLSALEAQLANVTSGTVQASHLYTMNLTATNTVRLSGHTCVWLSKKVCTGVTLNRTYITVPGGDGVDYTVASAVSLSESYDTIKYMSY